jgi:uncharacterized membrane protein YbhN (UPF0104 family)
MAPDAPALASHVQAALAGTPAKHPSASRIVGAGNDRSADVVPHQLSPRHVRRRLLEFAAIGAVIAAVALAAPGLGELRARLTHASPGWLAAGIALETLSALSYVVIFRAVFCPLMSWSLSSQIALSEQAANSVLSVSGTGGLALGAWALRRGGMNVEQIGRKTVAFFFLTSLANVGSVVALAALFALGALGDDPNQSLTYGAGAGALVAVVLVLAMPVALRRGHASMPAHEGAGRFARVFAFARDSLGRGLSDGLLLLRRHSPGVLIGSFGTMAFDLAVLGVSFRAFGGSPPLAVLALGYLIGQLGGNVPLPGGIGGVDAGLIGTFALFHQPLATATVAVLAYHAIALWIPGLLGGIAFLRLRRTLRSDQQPAAWCIGLAEPIGRDRASV